MMKQIEGQLKFINSDAKGDSLVLEDNTRIYLNDKGGARKFFGMKGAEITGTADSKTSQAGNQYYVSDSTKISLVDGPDASNASHTTNHNDRAARGQMLNVAIQLASAQGALTKQTILNNFLLAKELVEEAQSFEFEASPNVVNADII